MIGTHFDGCAFWSGISNINIRVWNKHIQLPAITPEISLAYVTYSQIFPIWVTDLSISN